MRRRTALGRSVSAPRFAAAALAAAACLAGVAHAAAPTPTAQVVLRDIAFKRAVTRVHPGQRVRWTWNDRGVAHNIHSVGAPRFAGSEDRRTGTHTVRFARKGTYRYTCTLHPGMNGTVVVR